MPPNPSSPLTDLDRWLVDRARAQDPAAWEELIARFEGRLFAFVKSRINDRTHAEDLVQETFLGFWNSLPNYDSRTPLESFLFAIASHKIVDHLRKQGRSILRSQPDSDSGVPEYADLKARVASSIARSAEQHRRDSLALESVLRNLIVSWKQRGEWERLKCAELLLVRAWPNQQVARSLGISEQAVANHKHFIIQKLRQPPA